LYVPGRTTTWNNRWRNLFDHFGQAIMAYARRCGLKEHSAEDVLQEVMTTLLRCQHGQEPDWNSKAGSFRVWLWGVIRNRVRSVRRQDATSALATRDSVGLAEGKLADLAAPSADFEALDEQRWEQALLAAALRKVQARVTAQNFAIYTALLQERAAPEELGRIYGKQPNAIYAIKHRCDKMLLSEAKLLRTAWEQLG
jgi:RNA polymerase sigma factor (sigma-70 family)